jgi:two-component system chemotaxis response regulator CheB
MAVTTSDELRKIMGPVNIVIAARSYGLRNQLSRDLAQFDDISVLAQARDLMETFAAIEDRAPHLVLLEQALSLSPEFEVMRAVFQSLDIRWLVVASEPSDGAPGQDRRRSLISADLFEMDQNMAPARIADTIRTVTRMSIQRTAAVAKKSIVSDLRGDDRLILIGASTGGVDALLSVLSGFPPDCPATLIVQHTGAGFGASLVGLLNRQCRPTVIAATDGARVARGQIIVAAGMRAHMRLPPGRDGAPMTIRLSAEGPVGGHIPSVDVLFHSALPRARRVVAALLTGMGRDGADGLLALRQAGAATLAQDAATCVVYGMPRAAAEMGAAAHILPLNKIGPTLLSASTHPIPDSKAVPS